MSADPAFRRDIPDATVARLPEYLRALSDASERGISSVSSGELAAAAGVRSTQLRKDLSHLGSYGIRGVGYEVEHLALEISRALGLTQEWPVAIVGMGNLGRALAAYSGFATGGFHVAAVFDEDPTLSGGLVADLPISPMTDLAALVREQRITIGVIATPAASAQQVCDVLVAAGVRSILNFAPFVLTVPVDVDVRRVDLSTELHVLAFREQRKSLPPELGGGPVSVLVIGLSHHTAPLSLLEAVAAADPAQLAARVKASGDMAEVVVVSTCNRLEVYAESPTFHGAVAAIGEALAVSSGVTIGDLSSHLYVHYEDRAVAHAFSVACGLDSMAVGEAQVLGQLREALRSAQRAETAGPSLNSLFQQALRVGKRAHAETHIDRVSHSLIEAGLEAATEILGPLDHAHVLVVGAGGMSSLAATTVSRRGVKRLTIVNRTATKAYRLAEALQGTTQTHARPLDDLDVLLAEVDVVITSTGSLGHHVTTLRVETARQVMTVAGVVRPQVFVDLALPRDVDPMVAGISGVTVIGLDDLGARLAAEAQMSTLPEVQAVTDLVTAEVAAYLTGRMEQSVVPTVAALRSRAHEVVDAEMVRLDQKLPDLEPATRAEVQRTVHRIIEKLLHTPTVRIKELSGDGHAGDYAAALRELFDLDPHDVAAVSVPPVSPAVPGASVSGAGGGDA